MTTPRVEGEGRTLRQSLYQDVAKRILLNQRVLDEMDHFTPTQVDLAGRVVSLLVMRRVLDREIARRMTPRGLAAVAALIGPHVQSIEQALGNGIVRKAEALLCRGPVPPSTQTRAALAQATILVG